MAAVRILLVIAFALGINSTGVFGSGFISYGTGKYEVAAGRRAPRNDARRLIEIAQGEIGVRETSQNSSVRIDSYNRYVGFKQVAWCASFVSYCFGQAGYKEPKTAWCPGLFPTARIVKEPLTGCVFGIYFPAKGRIAHCGIVEGVKGDFITSLEGNTNVAGSREGDRVMRKLRHKRTIAKYADWLRGN